MADRESGFLSGEPEHPVSWYVDDGMMLADGYMSSVLTREEYAAATEIADELVEFLERPLHAQDSFEAKALPAFLKHPWVRFAMEIQLVQKVSESSRALLDRHERVQPFLSSLDLNDKSRRYLAEARRTFLYGLDAACVAFCGAALEQVLREAIRPLPARELSLEQLIQEAERRGQLTRFVDAAHTLRKQRNHVMHTALWEERIEAQVALNAIRSLASVLSELGPE